METLVPARQDIHQIDVQGRRVLLHIPTTSLFELDEPSAALLDDSLHGEGRLQFDPDYRDVREELHRAGLLRSPEAKAAAIARAPVMPPKSGSLVSLVLNVNTGCNLSCSYCYKEDLAIPAQGRKMSVETALKSVDLLFAESGARDRLSLVFFGGEPLTNVPVIRAAVEYANEKSRQSRKQVQFSLTTNATLLTQELVDFFAEHHFGISISIDGPKAMHDRHRVTVGGRGTYDLVAKKARMLLSRKSRPVSARVTLTHASQSVIEIFDHLRYEIGFDEVGIAPVTAAKADGFGLDGADRRAFFEQLTELGERYVQAAIEGRNLGFANIHQSMLDLAHGNRKLVPCGAGVGLLAVDMEGKLNLCHRFTGSDLPAFGDLASGVDHRRLNGFLAEAQDRDARGCATCRIRNLCSGGCYHDNYTSTQDPLTPSYQHCDDLRAWMDFCIGAFVRIRARNPQFLMATGPRDPVVG